MNLKVEKMNEEFEKNVNEYGKLIEDEIEAQIPKRLRRLAKHRPFGRIICKILGLRIEPKLTEKGLKTIVYRKQSPVKAFTLVL